MRFNRYLPEETRTLLEEQYKDYIQNTPMTKKEQRAVREWVKDGHSVYENSSGGWYDGGVPIPFLEVYRDEEYIRIHTKDMSPDEARKFALSYYGWDDDSILESEPIPNESGYILDKKLMSKIEAELPFR
ncbi:hypothetical protein [Butyrivibrio sp. WCD3002]|uniref:hypothetical protein n=1 Tax=Butyrivibrio sp. WCD3002 TaxID=1280676 RepID=UPI0003FC3963|nr:hypothetical protein [Butyrivibrio sp. WCD3002]